MTQAPGMNEPASGPAAAPGPTASPKVTLGSKRAWDVARAQIEHEDNLINHRLTWLLISNGFLFASFAAGAGQFQKESGNFLGYFLYPCLGAIAVVAIVLCWIAKRIINLAIHQIDVVATWWETHPGKSAYPNIIGRDASYDNRWPRMQHLPDLLMYAWALLLSVLIVGGIIWYRSFRFEAVAPARAVGPPAQSVGPGR